MKSPMKSVLFVPAVLALFAVATPAMAIDQTRSGYNTLLAQSSAGEHAKVPASYRITLDRTRKPGAVEGANRYFGGKIRTLIIDGRPVRLSERDIIENIRSGRFVPVYTETGTRLSREDWIASLPYWLGEATHDNAGQ